MNYFVSRDGQEYGPYTLSDVQRYVASGNIAVSDLARSEGMTDWAPVSQIVGNIPVLVAAPPRPAVPLLRREGRNLVVTREAIFPPYCVKCGQPADGKPWEKNLSWCKPWIHLLIIVALLLWAIIYFLTRKQMRLTVPLCARHAHHRRKMVGAGIALLLASPWLIILGASLNQDAMIGFGVLVMVAMLVAGAIVYGFAAPLRPKKIDDWEGVFAGAGEPFLQAIDRPGSQAVVAGL
jgi:GYF domain 2